jgi:hypothetical protein
LSGVFLPVVFSTKGRFPFLSDEDVRREVHAVSAGIAMPAVVYSLFMFLSGGLIIWWFGRPNGTVAKTL